jgi:hypothetical protein
MYAVRAVAVLAALSVARAGAAQDVKTVYSRVTDTTTVAGIAQRGAWLVAGGYFMAGQRPTVGPDRVEITLTPPHFRDFEPQSLVQGVTWLLDDSVRIVSIGDYRIQEFPDIRVWIPTDDMRRIAAAHTIVVNVAGHDARLPKQALELFRNLVAAMPAESTATGAR